MIGPVLLTLVLLVPHNRVQDVERGLGRWREAGHQITVVPQWRTTCGPRPGGVQVCERIDPDPTVAGRFYYQGWIELHPRSWGNSRTVCHEVGHALGYLHVFEDRGDCMWSTVPNPEPMLADAPVPRSLRKEARWINNGAAFLENGLGLRTPPKPDCGAPAENLVRWADKRLRRIERYVGLPRGAPFPCRIGRGLIGRLWARYGVAEAAAF